MEGELLKCLCILIHIGESDHSSYLLPFEIKPIVSSLHTKAAVQISLFCHMQVAFYAAITSACE